MEDNSISSELSGNKELSTSITDMEVHHHPDLHHKTKKFKEYLLEFLMIFLAVTMGFIAESLRENISDGTKEREYMQSFLNDLRSDSLKITYTLEDNTSKAAGLDSLMQLSISGLSNPTNRLLLYRYKHYAGFYSIFRSNDATMQQLKNSGGLRIIKKDHVADSIAQYDYQVKIIYASEDLYKSATAAAIAATHQIVDNSVYYDTTYFKNNTFTSKPLLLLTDDPKKQKLFFNEIEYEKDAVDNYIRNINSRFPFLKSLIQFLKKEYDLE